MNINVMSFEDRMDLKQKQLMMFLEALQNEYQASGKGGVNLLGLTIERKTIRKYKEVVAGNNSVRFEWGNRNIQDGETFLDNSDAFMPVGIGIGFAKSIAIDTNQTPIANTVIYYYPDKFVFDSTAVATSPPEWAALQSYYWGQWQLNVNDKTVITELHGERTLKPAQVQQYENAAAYPYNQWEKFAWLYNTPLLDGNKSITLLNKPVATADTQNAAGESGEINYIVQDVEGFVVKDMSTAMNALNETYYFVK